MNNIDQIAENRKVWVAALRSGKYIQGHGTLKSTNEQGKTCHCVWGVAFEAMGVEPVLDNDDWEYNRCIYMPSFDLVEAFGLDGDDAADLMQMNDDKGKSFAWLADYIETLPLPQEGL